MSEIAIEVKNILKIYKGKRAPLIIFDDFSVSFKKNQTSVIIGPSGCGKSTLLRMIAGLEKPTKGEIVFHTASRRVGMIFQEKALFPWLTVAENIAFGLAFSDIPEKSHNEIKRYWLEKVDLLQFSDYYPAQISGGMKQKLAMARCLAVNPEIILMDEPFGSLDYHSKFEIIAFFEQLFLSEKKTVILVTHNVQEALYLGDSVVGLQGIPINNCVHIDIPEERPRSIEDIKSKRELYIERSIYSHTKTEK